jgi:uncharacterized protein (DUF849 family)
MEAMHMKKVVITVSVTGSIGNPREFPIPITPKDIAESALEAHKAGAAVAHIHVRDLETGAPSMKFRLYEEVVQRIRDRSDMIINLTTGAGARFIPDDCDPMGFASGSTLCAPQKRIEHILRLKPEICSLDVGSFNFGSHVFVNVVSHVEWMAEQIRNAGVKPELEIFDIGHIEIAKYLLAEGKVKSPPLFQLCMGIRWGIPATPYNMIIMMQQLPSDAIWTGFGISAQAFPVVAQSALLGGNVRIGFEDTLFLEKGKPASTNRELVEKAIEIIKLLGYEPTNTREARTLFNL